MARTWTEKTFFMLLKLAAVLAVVFAGFHFKDAKIGYVSPEKIGEVTSELGKQIIETRENLENKFPQQEGAVSKTYQWKYAGKNYAVSQTLYSSVYEFYRSQPKTYTYFNELPENWEEEYYGMFVAGSEKDAFIAELLDSIVVQGRKNKLTEDQLVELILAFVQSIPYDDQKAANILSRTGSETMDYPYEVLFENSGVCSDKSFLATVLFHEFGYGTAIFVFENENHMAIGIQCPKEYSDYGSGYCFAETTSVGNKIGIVPDLRANVGSAVGAEQIAYFDEGASQPPSATKLTEVKIFQKTEGKEYRGIIQTVRTNNEIATLKSELAVLTAELKGLKSEIDEDEEYLASKKKSLEKYLKNGEIDKYNKEAKKYNEALSDYEDEIKSYNKKVNSFNEKVQACGTIT
ncbi:MAG: hypothetical protein UY41_C0003G0004 [Candidatus Moranbacteria bacterium GW2011_GWE1_49_15]|nr:MAG: hypothetical protein UY41_C0003G0004 [Candidatus Moranbacteria bacterium GW2011_GWE1_49_15]